MQDWQATQERNADTMGEPGGYKLAKSRTDEILGTLVFLPEFVPPDGDSACLSLANGELPDDLLIARLLA